MLEILNNRKEVQSYVAKKYVNNADTQKQIKHLFELSKNENTSNNIRLINFIADMYRDLIWDCGYSENEVAFMEIELDQFVNDCIGIHSC
ncbi:hypothetical protein KDN24_06380 [Bacillus sp. Bva_UNVM-123]|uniref:hypothetical protein n=1 Tax=Bacillus sp. Bva_UNVM-123 TaxID=2829798 RepID=UPI00391F7552